MSSEGLELERSGFKWLGGNGFSWEMVEKLRESEKIQVCIGLRNQTFSKKKRVFKFKKEAKNFPSFPFLCLFSQLRREA